MYLHVADARHVRSLMEKREIWGHAISISSLWLLMSNLKKVELRDSIGSASWRTYHQPADKVWLILELHPINPSSSEIVTKSHDWLHKSGISSVAKAGTRSLTLHLFRYSLSSLFPHHMVLLFPCIPSPQNDLSRTHLMPDNTCENEMTVPLNPLPVFLPRQRH